MFGSRLTTRQWSPASSERQSSPSSFVSLTTYTIDGSLGATAMPMRSMSVFGRPRSIPFPDSFSQLSPPFTERYTAVLPPPDSRCHAQRRYVYIPAYRMFELPGSAAMSEHDVCGSMYNNFFHVLPPSVVLKTPRSSFGPHSRPRPQAYTRSGFFAS